MGMVRSVELKVISRVSKSWCDLIWIMGLSSIASAKVRPNSVCNAMTTHEVGSLICLHIVASTSGMGFCFEVSCSDLLSKSLILQPMFLR